MARTGPPPLPPAAPADVQAFFAGEADEARLEDGPVTWVPVPDMVRRVAGPRGVPAVEVVPAGHGARITLGWGVVGFTILVAVAAGRMTVAFPGVGNPFLRSLRSDVRGWIEQANDHLQAQGRHLHPLEVQPGLLVVRAGAR